MAKAKVIFSHNGVNAGEIVEMLEAPETGVKDIVCETGEGVCISLHVRHLEIETGKTGKTKKEA